MTAQILLRLSIDLASAAALSEPTEVVASEDLLIVASQSGVWVPVLMWTLRQCLDVFSHERFAIQFGHQRLRGSLQ